MKVQTTTAGDLAARLPTEIFISSGEHMALTRRRSGEQQADLAARLGVTQGYVSHMEIGVRSIPREIQEIFPAKREKLLKEELFWLLMHRAGMSHEEAKKLFNVPHRKFMAWLKGQETIPEIVFSVLWDKTGKGLS